MLGDRWGRIQGGPLTRGIVGRVAPVSSRVQVGADGSTGEGRRRGREIDRVGAPCLGHRLSWSSTEMAAATETMQGGTSRARGYVALGAGGGLWAARACAACCGTSGNAAGHCSDRAEVGPRRTDGR
jgi:hypothetical protein